MQQVIIRELKCVVRPYPQTNPGIHMDPKPYTKKPPPLPRPRSKSCSSSPLLSTKGRQRYSSIHGGHGLPPAVRHINTATVAPSSASKKPMSPQGANHGNVTEAVYNSPELCARHTSDEIHTQSNASYAGVSMPPTGIATTDVENSYSESHSLQQVVQKYSKSLPACVKVLQGYYGQNVELITDELYNVHFAKHQKVVTIKDTQGTVYSVPLASTLQFGPVFNEQESIDGTTFHKVSDIMALKVLPKVVCAMKAFQGADETSSVQENEILQVQSIEMHGIEALKVFSITTNSVKVLQANCEGDFSTKPTLIRLHLQDILTCIPCKAVMFIDETVTSQAIAKKFPSSVLSGSILITESKVETSLVASLSKKPAHKDSGKITLLDIPLADYLAEVEVAILESPSTQETQLLCDDTKCIMREFHPSKLKYLREMRSARAARLQSLLYAEVQKGQEMVGIELESMLHSGRASAEDEYSKGQASFSESLSLQQFVQKHSKSLPACVKVTCGYYGQSEDLELITDELYNVHFAKHQKVATIKDTQGTVYSVPLASTLQFGPVFNEQESMDGTTFHKVSDIMALKVLPKVVCAMKAFKGADESSSVRKNEILKIQSIEMRGKEAMKVFSITANSVKVLQANCKGDFSTKPSFIRLHLQDILTCIPCKAVMFIDETVTTLATAKVFPSSILSGPILIAESKVETSLVASFSNKTACEDSEIGTLLDIPLADYLSKAEVAILESPSTQEAQLLSDDTKRIMREFHPSKLKYLREMKSARAARLQSLLYGEVQKGQEMVGVELESSIADQFSLPSPSPLFKSARRGEKQSSLAEPPLPSKESESQHVYESLPGEVEVGERHFHQARRWTNFSVKPKQQPSGSIAGASKKLLRLSSAQYEAVENMYPQEKPKLPPKRTVGLKPSPKPAFVSQTEKPDVSAKPTSKLGDDSYVRFHTTAEPLLESQSKKHEPIEHLNDMRSTLEQVTQKLQSLDSQVQNLNLESASMEKSSSSTSPKEENKQYLHSLDNTQVRKS